MRTDVIVIGSGIAGLSFAIKMAEERPDISVIVITKNNDEVSSTARAQGGIAVVLDRVRDSFEQHIEDTIRAGKGRNNREVVEMVISQAPERLSELISWGTEFDADVAGGFRLGLEGGHSQRRIVHHRDLTGLEMQRKLLKKARSCSNITLYDHLFVIDLLLGKSGNEKVCTGIRILNKQTGKLQNIHSRITFLATGGSGMIFQNTTNPSVATGDGIAMAYRAGAAIRNMNYMQFHPTALFEKEKHPLFLISEAVRGYGAYVVNKKGFRFLFEHDPRGELATRDIVSQAIVHEIKTTGEDCVYLDCRHLEAEAFEKNFPTIMNYCSSLGLDPRTEIIPIVPAAHYQCGGIEVDMWGRTSIPGLYASGECAHTGLHGANRLASNSLLEALVYSHEASRDVLQVLDKIPLPSDSVAPETAGTDFKTDTGILDSLRQRLTKLMTYDLIYASEKSQKLEALLHLWSLEEMLENYAPFNSGATAFYEFRNMVQTAILILDQAILDESENGNYNRKPNLAG